MKRIILTVLSSIFTLSLGYAQDIITRTSNTVIKARVIGYTSTEIKYKKYNKQSGPTYTIPKSDVLMIQYENGFKEVLSDKRENSVKGEKDTIPTIKDTVPTITLAGEDLYIKGRKDASVNYDGYVGAGTGTLLTGLISPLVGLIPAVICSTTPPQDINLNYPDAKLIKDPEYYRGYVQQSKKIKQGKVWANWGTALAVNLFAVVILSAGQ